MAEPSPRKKFCDNVNAPGGKLKARAASKWLSPATMIQPIVPITPTHSSFDIQPMLVILRYKSTTTSTTAPIATNVAPVTSQTSCSVPSAGICRFQLCTPYGCSSLGQKYDA